MPKMPVNLSCHGYNDPDEFLPPKLLFHTNIRIQIPYSCHATYENQKEYKYQTLHLYLIHLKLL